jgi:hypothetical protein
MTKPEFTVEKIQTSSKAAASLFRWCVAVVNYHHAN